MYRGLLIFLVLALVALAFIPSPAANPSGFTKAPDNMSFATIMARLNGNKEYLATSPNPFYSLPVLLLCFAFLSPLLRGLTKSR